VLRGVPFRKAHHAVGRLVALAGKLAVPLDKLPFDQVRKAHPGFGKDWAKVFDLQRALKKRRGTGMPGMAQVARQVRRWKRLLGAG
jgi:argininosuccinate lyase